MKTDITLKRNKYPVNTLFSAFGRTKETTLTAGLAYLIWKFPKIIGKLFVKRGVGITEVSIEESEKDSGRYDVLLSTNKYDVLIEAKRGSSQNKKQIRRYLKRKNTKLVLVDSGSPLKNSWVKKSINSKRDKTSFVSWGQIYKTLKKIDSKTQMKREPVGWAIAKDLYEYMGENEMTEKRSKEIYVRDLSGDSINLFFKYHIYKSQPKYFKSASGNAYFAPYFTGKARHYFEEQSIKGKKGITWIASVKHVEVVKKNHILQFLKKNKWPNFREASKEFKRQTRNSNKELIVMLLGEPFQMFVTPVEKSKLNQFGPMGSKSFTFEELFTVAGK